jgi:hypothetical protein
LGKVTVSTATILSSVIKVSDLTAGLPIARSNAESDLSGLVGRSLATNNAFLNDLKRNFSVTKHACP